MGIEIERKFLVVGSDWKTENPRHFIQGYLSTLPNCTVRIRVSDADAWLTIKGIASGATRAEFEYPIPLTDAKELLPLCEQPPLEKLRHHVSFCGKLWEVDEFQGENAGLVLAEIELEAEDEVFDAPPWVGKEVTAETRYFNSQLAQHPFCRWSDEPESQ